MPSLSPTHPASRKNPLNPTPATIASYRSHLLPITISITLDKIYLLRRGIEDYRRCFPSLRAPSPEIKNQRRAMWERRDKVLIGFTQGGLEKMPLEEMVGILKDVEGMLEVLSDARGRGWVGGEGLSVEYVPGGGLGWGG